jgi:UDP-glucose 4-epimerase
MENYDVAIIGAGFIGSSLAAHLQKLFDVVTFDVNPQPQWLKGYDIPHKICDIRNYRKLNDKIGNPRVVIHTAIIQIPVINEKKGLAYEVNVLGTHNVCRIVEKNENTKGFILTGSWHVFGEREFQGIISEGFGYRPDKVEERARLYAISKILQECIVRFYDEKNPDKVYGILRMATVLGEHMPEKTAANIFITRALSGESITPYKHSMHRPMLYVDINDVCKGFESYIKIIMESEKAEGDSSSHIINVAYHKPITIMELANIVRDSVIKHTNGKINPIIEIVDKGVWPIYSEEESRKIKVDINRAKELLGLKKLISPRESIDRIVKYRLQTL